MRVHETYYTPERLAQLEARREEVGDDEIAAVERRALGADEGPSRCRHGSDRSRGDALARQNRTHDRRLHQRRPGITESLGRVYKEEGPEKASRGTFDADLLEYVTRAQRAG